MDVSSSTVPDSSHERSAAASTNGALSVLNLTNQNLRKISLPDDAANGVVKKVMLDKNQIIKIENLEILANTLEQLSVASNRLVRLVGLSTLINLKVLNVPHNSIAVIEGLNQLKNLVWLNLSNNNIKSLDGVIHNTNLTYLDLSHNNLTALSADVKSLTRLKTLMLQGNLINSLSTAPQCLPMSITTLSLAENEVSDLCHFCYLSCLPKLEQLTVHKNPCVEFCLNKLDYRPYILNWCLNLSMLDSSPVTHRESLKAEWLYTQGKGRKFRPGEMNTLIDYLKTHCPLNSSDPQSEPEENSEDIRLSRVLNKQLKYQKQLHSNTASSNTSRAEMGGGDRGVYRVSERAVAINGDRRVDATQNSLDEFSTLTVAPFAKRAPVRNDESLKRQQEGTPKRNDAEASSVQPSSNIQSSTTHRPGLPANHGHSSQSRQFLSHVDDEEIEEELDLSDAGLSAGSSLLVSSSFLLPAQSPPAIPLPEIESNVRNSRQTTLAATSNLDEVSFSELMPGPDLPPVPAPAHTSPNDVISIIRASPTPANQQKQTSSIVSDLVTHNNKESSNRQVRSSRDMRVKPNRSEVRISNECQSPVQIQFGNRIRNANSTSGRLNLPSDNALLALLTEAAVIIQANWRGYLYRKSNWTTIRLTKNLASLRIQVRHLTEEINNSRSFQAITLQLFSKIISQKSVATQSNKQTLNETSTLQLDADNTNGRKNRNVEPALKDTLNALRDEFSRMSCQFTSGNGDSQMTEANDTSTSSLRVMSLTEEDLSHWGLDDHLTQPDEENGNGVEEDTGSVHDDTFTESEQVDLLSASALLSPTAVNAPTNVRVKIKDNSSLLISWKHPEPNTGTVGSPLENLGYPQVSVLSYKLVVDGVPRGVVSAAKTNAVIQGLDVNKQQFSVTVRAVTALGESANSFPPVQVGLSQEQSSTKHTLLNIKTTKTQDDILLNAMENVNQLSLKDNNATEQEPLMKFSTILKDTIAFEGEEAVFKVILSDEVNSEDIKSVSWFKNEICIKDDHRVSQVQSGVNSFEIHLNDCKLSDDGSISCVVESLDRRKISSFCRLEVKPSDNGKIEKQTHVSKSIGSMSDVQSPCNSPKLSRSQLPAFSTELSTSLISKYRSLVSLNRSSDSNIDRNVEQQTETTIKACTNEGEPEQTLEQEENDQKEEQEISSNTTELKRDSTQTSSVGVDVSVSRLTTRVVPMPQRSKSPPLRSTTSSRGVASNGVTTEDHKCTTNERSNWRQYSSSVTTELATDVTQSISISASPANTLHSGSSCTTQSNNDDSSSTQSGQSSPSTKETTEAIDVASKTVHEVKVNNRDQKDETVGSEDSSESKVATLTAIENLQEEVSTNSPQKAAPHCRNTAIIPNFFASSPLSDEKPKMNKTFTKSTPTFVGIGSLGLSKEPARYAKMKRTRYFSHLVKDAPY